MSKEEPKVSVVIPTYNREKKLPNAVNSAIEQSLNNIEIIVVDDGSSDQTEDIIKSYTDPRLRYIAHGRNQGGAQARNTGINHASGKYIAFLDSDDEWKPDKLEQQIKSIESRSNEWIASYTGYEIKERNDNNLLNTIGNYLPQQTGETLPTEGGEEIIKTILMRQLPHGGSSSLLIKRETVERIGGFDESFKRHQDWEFLIRLAMEGKIARVDSALFLKEPSEFPSATIVEEAKTQYFEKFKTEIDQAESMGYDVTAVHRFQLASHFSEQGDVIKSIRYLYGARPLQKRNYMLIPIKIVDGIIRKMIK